MPQHKVLFSTFAASLILAGGAEAQKKFEAHFGVLAGIALGKLGGDATKNQDIKNRVGIAGGAFVTLGLNENFAIEPELLYTVKGAKVSGDGATGTFELSYIEIPLLAKVRFPAKSGGQVSPHLYAGPYLAFKSGCSIKATNNTTTVSQTCKAAEVMIKSSDFGATVGAGVDIGRAIIDVRYDLGLSKISAETTDNDVKTRTIYFLAGWTFRSPK